jgi:predicted enzyme related to lactoylglutathione lyase
VIERVHSFAIFVNNLDRATEFYRDTLGLPVHQQGSFGLELFLEPPHVGVHPAVHPNAKALVGRHTGITFYVPGLLHFCGVLHERGGRFVSEPTRMEWPVMAMIADPEANIFALWDDSAPAEG